MKVEEDKRLRPPAAFTLVLLKMRFAIILELALLLATASTVSCGGLGNNMFALSEAEMDSLKAKGLKPSATADDLLSNDLFDRLWSAVGTDESSTTKPPIKATVQVITETAKMETHPPTVMTVPLPPRAPVVPVQAFQPIDHQELLQPNMDKTQQKTSQMEPVASEELTSQEEESSPEKIDEPPAPVMNQQAPQTNLHPEPQVPVALPQREESKPIDTHSTLPQPLTTEPPTAPPLTQITTKPRTSTTAQPETEMTTTSPTTQSSTAASTKTIISATLQKYPWLWPLTRVSSITAMTKKYLDNIRDLGPGPRPHLHQLAQQADIDSVQPPPIGKSKRSATTSKSADADIYDVDSSLDENRQVQPQLVSNQATDVAERVAKLKAAFSHPSHIRHSTLPPTTSFPLTTQTMSMLDQLQIKLIAHSEAAARHKAMMSTRSLFTMPRIPMTSISYIGGPLNRVTQALYVPTPVPQSQQSRHFQSPVRNYPPVIAHQPKFQQQNMPHFVNLPSQEVPKVQDILMELEKENAAHLASLHSNKRGLTNTQSSLFGRQSQQSNTRFKKHAKTTNSYGKARRETSVPNPADDYFKVPKDAKKESRGIRSMLNQKHSSNGRLSSLVKSSLNSESGRKKSSLSKTAALRKKPGKAAAAKSAGQHSTPRSPPKPISAGDLTEVRMIGLPFGARSSFDEPGSRRPVMRAAPRYPAGMVAPQMPEYSHHQPSISFTSQTTSNRHSSASSSQHFPKYSSSYSQDGPPVLSSKDSLPIADHLAAMMDQMALPQDVQARYNNPTQPPSAGTMKISRPPLKYASSMHVSRSLEGKQQIELPEQQPQQRGGETQKPPEQGHTDNLPEYQTPANETPEPTAPPPGKPVYINPAIVKSTQFSDDEPDNGKGMALPYERLDSPSAIAASATSETLLKEIRLLKRALRDCESQNYRPYYGSIGQHREPLELIRANSNQASLFNAPPRKTASSTRSVDNGSFRLDRKPKVHKDAQNRLQTLNSPYSNSHDSAFVHSHGPLDSDVELHHGSNKRPEKQGKQKDENSDDQQEADEQPEINHSSSDDGQVSSVKGDTSEPTRPFPHATPIYSESSEVDEAEDTKVLPEQQLIPTTNDHSVENTRGMLLAASSHADTHSTRMSPGVTNVNSKSGLGKRESKSSPQPAQAPIATQQSSGPSQDHQTTTMQQSSTGNHSEALGKNLEQDSDEASFPAGKSSMDSLRNNSEENTAPSAASSHLRAKKLDSGKTWTGNGWQDADKAEAQDDDTEGSTEQSDEGQSSNFDMGSDSTSAEEDLEDGETSSEKNMVVDGRGAHSSATPSSITHTALLSTAQNAQTQQAITSVANLSSQVQQVTSPVPSAPITEESMTPTATSDKTGGSLIPGRQPSLAATINYSSTLHATKTNALETSPDQQRMTPVTSAQSSILHTKKVPSNNEVKFSLPSTYHPIASITASIRPSVSTIPAHQVSSQHRPAFSLHQRQQAPVQPSMDPSAGKIPLTYPSRGQPPANNISSAAQLARSGELSKVHSSTTAASLGSMVVSSRKQPLVSQAPLPLMNSTASSNPPVPPPPARRRPPEDRMGSVPLANQPMSESVSFPSTPVGGNGDAKPPTGLKPRSARVFGRMSSAAPGAYTDVQPNKIKKEGEPPAE